MLEPFSPTGSSHAVTATATSQVVTVTVAGQLEVTNIGPGVAFLRWAKAADAPVALAPAVGVCDYPVTPGQCKVVSIGNCDTVAVVADALGATVYLTSGLGV